MSQSLVNEIVEMKSDAQIADSNDRPGLHAFLRL